MKKCIFCDIIKSKLNAYKIYEDSKILCILDKKPISKGHCLIFPKKHFKDIFDSEEDHLKQTIVVAKKVAHILKQKLKAEGINILHASKKAAQQSIFHFHFHIIPRYKKDTLNTWPKSNYKEKSLEETHKKII